ncbi:TPA: hypothetical protein MHL77_24890 [Klebsiella pneumoniae]|nr:hypothetical protein [Salmonella enterica subsp. enterica serovar Enteritidis]HBZ1987827.1 hypothetical protein [Klebsiella pneumoniae]HBZ1998981.1 hypothetical protein [Klebsiella pneumoniae]HBZ2026337.1 hypothetical protein [Klebsiella pneumoniae]HBZ2839383.1 hypothetical protein [Klebsiella pneumoniae]
MTNVKARYIVISEGNIISYQGNNRMLAWCIWLINRHRKSVAYDCRAWILDPAYWLRGEKPPRISV